MNGPLRRCLLDFPRVLCLIFLLLAGCAQKKKTIAEEPPLAIPPTTVAANSSVAEILKAHFDDPQYDMITAFEECARESCKDESEGRRAGRLKDFHTVLKDKKSEKISVSTEAAINDYKALITEHRSDNDYVVPVVFHAWFVGGAIYPYSKKSAQTVFSLVGSERRRLDRMPVKPPGYYYLTALDVEYSDKAKKIDKAQAYKKCMELEPSNKRCQEGYLNFASSGNIQKVEEKVDQLIDKCQNEIAKSGFSLHLGQRAPSQQFSKMKSFSGRKYFFDPRAVLDAKDIKRLHFNEKNKSMDIQLTDSGQRELKKAQKKKASFWLLVRQDLIYASSPNSGASLHEGVLSLTRYDEEGLKNFKVPCK